MKQLFQTALEKRKPLLTQHTNALRIFDGAADGIPDLFLETYAGKLLLATRTNQIPDPVRAYLKSTGQTTYWKQLDQHQKENPTHLCGPPQNKTFIAKESGLNYHISFQSGYSQGIFLDQRENRIRVRKTAKPGHRILNTFAYTGAFSVAAAAAGATTTTLDLSQPYLDWAKNNLRANHIDTTPHYFCKGDTFHWLRRFAKQGRTFHGIILDPPTFSRDHKGNIFRVETDYHELTELAAACLEPGGYILASTNIRKLNIQEFTTEATKNLPTTTKVTPLPMPQEYPGEPYLKTLWLQP